MQITSTKRVAYDSGLKLLVHGPPGAGKTRLCSTTGALEKTLIISAEGGLLSIKEFDIDVVEVHSVNDLYDVYEFIRGGEHHYEWVCLDSISEIAEVVLQGEKMRNRDARRAYGEMADTIFDLIRGFRNLSCNVLMTAKQGREEIDGRTLHAPMLPGRKLTQNVAYLFDEVFALRVEQNDEGEPVRVLQTGKNRLYECKDRSGVLAMFEAADLAYVCAKIRGEQFQVHEEEEEEEAPVVQTGVRGERRVAVSVSPGRRAVDAGGERERSTTGGNEELRRANLRRKLFSLLKGAGVSTEQIKAYIEARCLKEHKTESINDVPLIALEGWAMELDVDARPARGQKHSPRKVHVLRVLKAFQAWKAENEAA